jgi:hypothetical protein
MVKLVLPNCIVGVVPPFDGNDGGFDVKQDGVLHDCVALGLEQFDCACPVVPSERLQSQVAVLREPLVEEHGPEHEVQLVVFPVVKNHVRTVNQGDWYPGAVTRASRVWLSPLPAVITSRT